MIKLIILDVDGCLASENIVIDSEGLEYKSFNIKDGLGIQSFVKMGGHVAIISGRVSRSVEHRAKEIGITKIIMGSKDKVKDAEELFKSLDLTAEDAAFMGDDLNDIRLLKSVAMSFCPANACDAVKEVADHTLKNVGGHGVVREMIEFILKKEGKYDDFIKRWL